MQAARARDFFQFAPNLSHTVADQAAIRFDLRFTRTAEKAEPPALALQVSPAAHQSPGLIIQMGKFHLQPAFSGRGALTKDFKDQPGAVDNLGSGSLFQIALLDRAQPAIDNDQLSLMGCNNGGNLFHLP